MCDLSTLSLTSHDDELDRPSPVLIHRIPGEGLRQINDAIPTGKGEMTEMTARLERMQIVLDTGVLVGEMAAPMDAALGQRATYKGRGNVFSPFEAEG